jgi:uncharacterized membrane protein
VTRERVRWLMRSALALLALAYPLAVYLGITRFGTRFAAWLLLVAACVNALLRSRTLRRPAWRSALAIPLCASALWLDDRRYVLALPVLINAGLFISFYSSLHTPTPLVERFARMQVTDLSAAELAYCRTVTKVWCGFFVFNGGIAALLAAASALDAWALYTGLISYLLIGMLGATEYTVRKYRFGRYGAGPHDRLLRALLKPRSSQP